MQQNRESQLAVIIVTSSAYSNYLRTYKLFLIFTFVCSILLTNTPQFYSF